MRAITLMFVIVAVGAIMLFSASPRGAETAFPGANGRIVYTVYVGTNDLDIWSINPDGSDPQQLTGGSYYDYEPSVSPDGMKIAFSSNRDTGETNEQLYVMDIDGQNLTRLTTNAFYDYGPAWSPDGQFLAFTSDRAGNPELYRMPAVPGGAATRLTDDSEETPRQDDEASWSPDGSKIAYMRYINAGEIWVMNADGTGKTSLTDAGKNNRPDWSPDGSKIVFDSYRNGPEEIFTMTSLGFLEQPIFSVDRNYSAVWSPDGAQVAFSHDPGLLGGGYEVWVANANGTGAHRVTPENQDAFEPSWAPVLIPETPTFSPSPSPAPSPTPTPVATASPTPTDEPTDEPTATPTPTPEGLEVVWGDNNCSGAADPVDALLTLRDDAGLSTNTGACPPFGAQVEVQETQPAGANLQLWGDADCSGAVDPVDALKLLRFDAGLSVSNPAVCPNIGDDVSIIVVEA